MKNTIKANLFAVSIGVMMLCAGSAIARDLQVGERLTSCQFYNPALLAEMPETDPLVFNLETRKVTDKLYIPSSNKWRPAVFTMVKEGGVGADSVYRLQSIDSQLGCFGLSTTVFGVARSAGFSTGSCDSAPNTRFKLTNEAFNKINVASDVRLQHISRKRVDLNFGGTMLVSALPDKGKVSYNSSALAGTATDDPTSPSPGLACYDVVLNELQSIDDLVNGAQRALAPLGAFFLANRAKSYAASPQSEMAELQAKRAYPSNEMMRNLFKLGYTQYRNDSERQRKAFEFAESLGHLVDLLGQTMADPQSSMHQGFQKLYTDGIIQKYMQSARLASFNLDKLQKNSSTTSDNELRKKMSRMLLANETESSSRVGDYFGAAYRVGASGQFRLTLPLGALFNTPKLGRMNVRGTLPLITRFHELNGKAFVYKSPFSAASTPFLASFELSGNDWAAICESLKGSDPVKCAGLRSYFSSGFEFHLGLNYINGDVRLDSIAFNLIIADFDMRKLCRDFLEARKKCTIHPDSEDASIDWADLMGDSFVHDPQGPQGPQGGGSNLDGLEMMGRVNSVLMPTPSVNEAIELGLIELIPNSVTSIANASEIMSITVEAANSEPIPEDIVNQLLQGSEPIPSDYNFLDPMWAKGTQFKGIFEVSVRLNIIDRRVLDPTLTSYSGMTWGSADLELTALFQPTVEWTWWPWSWGMDSATRRVGSQLRAVFTATVAAHLGMNPKYKKYLLSPAGLGSVSTPVINNSY